VKNIKLTLFCVCFAAALFAESDYTTTPIGVFNLYTNTGDSLMAVEAVRSVRDALEEIGRYNVFTQDRMEEAYEIMGGNFPSYCHEPRCAAVLGSSLQLDRMILGDVAFNNERYAVMLKMVDVTSRKIVNECNLQGEQGAALDDVVKTAIFRMHEIDTLSTAVELTRYFGEEVNNIKPMIISSSSYMGVGLLIALIGNDFQKTPVKMDNKLSGIDPSMRTVAKSARAKAMGNCYVALSKDAYGAFYNPAGASWIDGPQASLSYQNRFGLLNTVSASFMEKATREIGWGHSLIYSGHPESFYQELYFSTLASYRFSDLWILPPFSAGANLSVSSARTTGGSGSEYDQSGTAYGFGLDIGFLIELSNHIDFGLVFNNVPTFNFYHNSSSSEKEIGSEIYKEYRYNENSPPSLSLGGSFTASYATLLVAEGKIPLYRDQNWRFAGGLEQQIAIPVRLRFGAAKEIFTDFETPWYLTCGGGVRFPVRKKVVDVDISYEFMTDRELRNVWDISFKVNL